MKKGISLIVLIITIVVIIVLATAVIVNLAQTNIVNNAKEATFKNDIVTLKTELELFISNEYVNTKGDYNRSKLNANENVAVYNGENIEDKNKDGKVNINDILSSLNNTKLKEIVYIEEGNLIFKKNKLTKEEIIIIQELGAYVDGMPKILMLESESDYTNIKINVIMNDTSEVEKYKYYIDDVEVEESDNSSKIYSELNANKIYTIKVAVLLKDGTQVIKIENMKTKEDIIPPTIPTTLELSATINSITANASGSIDEGIGELIYEYSINNETWQENGSFENLKSGTEYSIYVRAVDKVGNISEVKEEKISTLNLNALEIKNNASIYYGKKVNNYTAPNGYSGWQIFHSDGVNIYLIADTYLASSLLPTTKSGYKLSHLSTSSYSKTYNLFDVTKDYSGTSDITDERIKALNSKMTATKAGYCGKALAYVLDIEIWNKKFKADNADYAIGGPTLELLFDSYNQKYKTNYETIASDKISYRIRKTSSSTWSSNISDLIDDNDSQYTIKGSTSAEKMYIPTLVYGDSGSTQLYSLDNSGNIRGETVVGTVTGFRPIVCLNSSVELEFVNDSFNITD